MVLPSVARAWRPLPVADPWETETKVRRRRAVGVVLAKLRGNACVSSGAGAVWDAPRSCSDDPLEDLAVRLDAAALRLARGRGALDLAIGEALDLLFTSDRLNRLGNWKRQTDFARERFGLRARKMYEFLATARQAKALPALRLAVLCGDVSPRKACLVAPAIRNDPEREAFLMQAAKTMTHPEIEKILEDLGEEIPKDPFVTRAKRFSMSAEMQAHLDRAIELAKSVEGHGKPRFVYEEAIAMEFLAAHADLLPEPKYERHRPPPGFFPPSPADRERLLAEWEGRDTREIEEALRFLLIEVRDIAGRRPEESELPEELESRILRFLSFRRQWDEPLGRVLETMSTLRLHTYFGFKSFAVYARDRLGISERGARERVWLERKMAKLPLLRMALRTGRLTYTKAVLVAKDATPEDVVRRIRAAAETTSQQLDRKSTEEEDRHNLAVGIRRIWGPEETMETIEAAIRVAKAVFFREKGLRITDGEALGLVAAHFIDQWEDPVRRKRLSRLRREVLARTNGICAVPGCGNPVDDLHHIVYRSHQGPDEAWNLAGLCFSCHRQIHRGRMRLEGRAGERLQWQMWRGNGRWEVWETTGDDEVRRLGELAPLPGIRAG